MSWNTKYWDALDQIYWTLEYVGLQKLKTKTEAAFPDYLLVPRSDILKGNSVFTRKIRPSDIAAHLHTREELLNHVLNIGLAIAPDSLIERIVCGPLGFTDNGEFQSLGRELDQRYGLSENAFQPDGLFVSTDSVLALEIKLQSPSSPEQIVKYASVLVLEEIFSGPKKNVGLLYIVPDGAEVKLWRSCGLDGPTVDPGFLEIVAAKKKSAPLNRLIDAHGDRIRAMLSRMTLGCVSWTWFRDEIATIESALDKTDPAQQCYQRLLIGLRHQLEAHGGTGLGS